MHHRPASEPSPGQTSSSTTTAVNSPSQSSTLNRDGPGAVGEETVPAQPGLGTLELSNTEVRYQGPNHWTSVLDAIAELKGDVQETERTWLPEADPKPSTPTPPDTILLFSGCTQSSREEVMAALPPRPLSDCLVSQCFEALDLVSCLINKDGFWKEYNSFWNDPDSAPIAWVGLLFSMLCIAAQYRDNDYERLRSLQPEVISQTSLRVLAHEYHEKTIQCLMLARYTKGGPYVIETLIQYIAAVYVRQRDANNDVWLALVHAIHLAMRMGYHRDPKHFKHLSPYDGEMRRRVWLMLYYMDNGLSSQIGMPRTIKDVSGTRPPDSLFWPSVIDAAEPRNLLDSDFDVETIELPPSRPETEMTPMLVILSKTRIARIYATVADLATDTKPCPYSEILRIDEQLKRAFANLPSYFEMRPVSESVMDPPTIIAQRIHIQMSYHKTQIALHRRYLALGRDDERYSYSRRTVVQAALQLLKYQQLMDQEMQPCGRLYPVRWRITSLINSDYLLATVVICFYLQHSGEAIDPEELGEIKEVMRKTRSIWIWGISTSTEAKKAVEAINAVLPDIPGIDEDAVPGGAWNHTPPSEMSAENFLFPPNQGDSMGFHMPYFMNSIFGVPSIGSIDFNNMETLDGPLPSSFIDPWFQPVGNGFS
ncbi:Uu.00g041150.m01.CDS01 [Anthostomella pinea]|uniref:Uu.00g041150.m01.CDS01 n=1 Tax=Anthostomella pinea TaxID=933095 RepID=A0AAI8VAV0_9PEZI|nr:Uu.00g041150.m01.CDS01 [Anthostomella pinea]